MARAHLDTEIKATYVREVCRLMRASNINIIKADLELIDYQEEIDKERAKDIKQGQIVSLLNSNQLIIGT
jgi:hypothetical protein